MTKNEKALVIPRNLSDSALSETHLTPFASHVPFSPVMFGICN
jgi:hypothetical protein